MEHTTRLDADSFEDMQNKSKTIEIRLFDEKRQALAAGDRIHFYKRPLLNEKVTAEIVALKKYPTTRELIMDSSIHHLGQRYSSWTKEKYIQYIHNKLPYSQKEIEQYGLVAIYLKHD